MLIWVVILAGAGLIGGTLAGLLGVGGGIVTVPVLYNIFSVIGVEEELKMKIAVATSLATIIGTSLSSIRSHHERGAIDFDLLRSWSPSIFVGVVIGTAAGGYFDGSVLLAVFATVAMIIALQMILRGQSVKIFDGFPNPVTKYISGFVVGFISALMGIGGGTLSVPILSAFNFEIRRAVGTAAAIGFIIAVPGTLGYIVAGWNVPARPPLSLGYLNLLGAAILVPTTMSAAPLGARLAHTIPRRALQLCFGAFLAISAGKMFYDLLT